jgi:hypothetical protein
MGPNHWYIGPVTVTLTAQDSGSGVQRIEYMLGNKGKTQIYSGPFVVDPTQVSNLYVIAVDRAGNVEINFHVLRIGPDHVYLPAIRR